jgi:uncharacterized protein (DUF433 family)
MKKWEKHIEANAEIMYGKPVIKGTRIPVDLILEKMANGQNFQEINKDYPDINKEDFYTCLNYISPS